MLLILIRQSQLRQNNQENNKNQQTCNHCIKFNLLEKYDHNFLHEFYQYL